MVKARSSGDGVRDLGGCPLRAGGEKPGSYLLLFLPDLEHHSLLLHGEEGHRITGLAATGKVGVPGGEKGAG
jgi:hypothetical protein